MSANNLGVNQDNRKVLRQFLLLPIILGALLLATGIMGIYISNSSSQFLNQLNERALGPTAAFDEITVNLNELSKNLLRLDGAGQTPEEKVKTIKRVSNLLKKISGKVKNQIEVGKGAPYSDYLTKWQVTWTGLETLLKLKIDSQSDFTQQISKVDGQLVELIEGMSNINTFIQADVEDILKQSTAFSKKARNILIFTLIGGFLIGLLFSILIVRSIRKLFMIIDESKKNMQTLLDNLDQGFCVFDEAGKVLPEVSKAAKLFFGKDPAGETISEIIPYTEKSKRSFQSWQELAFGGTLSFESFLPLAPNSFEHGERYVEMDFRPIYQTQDPEKLSKVICIASDKTEERKFRLKAETEATLVKVVMTILSDRRSFVDFVLESRKNFRDLEAEVKAANPKFDVLFRGMHSLKGSCAAFHMTQLSNDAHHFESQLSDLKGAEGEKLKQYIPNLSRGLEALNKQFEGFLKSHENVLGPIEESSDRAKTLSMQIINQQCQLIEKEIGKESSVFKSFIENFVQDDIAKLFQRYEGVVKGVAERQFKSVDFEIENNKVKVFSEPYGPLVGSYIHVFRNAIDHGLEDEEVRVANGKPATGSIKVLFNTFRDDGVEMLRIEVRDDGKGIDPKFIKQKAVEKKVISQAEADSLNDQQAIQLLFKSGFSTNDVVTDLSGRGVGLEALQYEAKAMGGKAMLESEPGIGTTLIVDVPYHKFVVSSILVSKPSQKSLVA